MRIKAAIDKTYKNDQFWDVLMTESEAQSGPFEGGSLICAKALLIAVEGADLVRITSELNGGQAEHYGVRLNNSIYDMGGMHKSESEWISIFKKIHCIADRVLGFAVGYDECSRIPDDPYASKKISQIIAKHFIN
jgi:hypothetical protein